MSATRAERRLLEKARRLRIEIGMLEAARELQIEKAAAKKAARSAERARFAGRELADKNFDKLGADEIRRAITEKRLREENERYAALRKEILLSGYLLSDKDNEALADANAKTLSALRKPISRPRLLVAIPVSTSEFLIYSSPQDAIMQV